MIETNIVLSVCPDPDYHFDVSVADELSVTYVEHGRETANSSVSFGSLEEMEAVAKAMLRVVKLAKES